MEFGTLDVEVHERTWTSRTWPIVQDLLAGNRQQGVIARASLDGVPSRSSCKSSRTYVGTPCFGERIDLEAENTRQHLQSPDLQDGIVRYLATEIGRLTFNGLTSSSRRQSTSCPRPSRSSGDATAADRRQEYRLQSRGDLQQL